MHLHQTWAETSYRIAALRDDAEAVADSLLLLAAGPDLHVAGYWAMDGELPLHVWQLKLRPNTVYCLPVLDVPVVGSHDVIGDRAFGDAPAIVTALGRRMSDGLLAGGVLLLELDPRNAPVFATELRAGGWTARVLPDLTGRERFVRASRNSERMPGV